MRYALIAVVLASLATTACEPMKEVCLKETYADNPRYPKVMANEFLRDYVMGRPLAVRNKLDPTRTQPPGCHFALEAAQRNLKKLDAQTQKELFKYWADKADERNEPAIAKELRVLGGIDNRVP